MFDYVAVLNNKWTVKLIASTQVHTVITNAPTPEDAVTALLQAAPPVSIKCTFVLSHALADRHRSIKALQKAGYINIETIDVLSLNMSSRILDLPLNCAVGDVVFVVSGHKEQLPWYDRHVVAIRKCENGWLALDKPISPRDALARYPSTRHFVIDDDAPEADKAEIIQFFGDGKVHLSALVPSNFEAMFILNRFNKGDLNGYEVLPYCHYDVLVQFGSECDTVTLTDRVPPFTISMDVDVGGASTVKIYADEHMPGDKLLVKTFKFKGAAFRTVEITVNVDKTLLPQVTLETEYFVIDALVVPSTIPANPVVSSYPKRQGATQSSVVYAVMDLSADVDCDYFLLVTYHRDETFEEEQLWSINGIISHINDPSALIIFCYSGFLQRERLKEFRDSCFKAGYRNIRLLSSQSVQFSMLLHTAVLSVSTGQRGVIGLWPYGYVIFENDGERLKTRKSAGLLSRVKYSEIAKYNVDFAVIQDFKCYIPKETFDCFRRSVPAENFHVVSLEGAKMVDVRPYTVILDGKKLDEFCPKFLWSLADGSDFNGCLFDDFCDFDILVESADYSIWKFIQTRFKSFPFTVIVDIEVEKESSFHVYLFKDLKEVLVEYDVPHDAKSVRCAISVESACDITVIVDVVDMLDDTDVSVIQSLNIVDDTGSLPILSKELSQPELDPPPTTILTFTSDNRAMIEADETYTGDAEVLAYVRLRSRKVPQVGKQAFSALKRHPHSVFYDITRLLATDFDPNYPHPMWSFKTTRGGDGKVVIHGGGNIKTTPIVLFGLVVNSTLLYIKEHIESDVTTLGIQLPLGCAISDDDLMAISEKIGVELVIC
uniref:RNA helicase n=2 Tax=Panagrellus redivivus TaxID=6233 RepID=A0A7E4V6D2_PANRE